jgi:hypothetical protein
MYVFLFLFLNFCHVRQGPVYNYIFFVFLFFFEFLSRLARASIQLYIYSILKNPLYIGTLYSSNHTVVNIQADFWESVLGKGQFTTAKN